MSGIISIGVSPEIAMSVGIVSLKLRDKLSLTCNSPFKMILEPRFFLSPNNVQCRSQSLRQMKVFWCVWCTAIGDVGVIVPHYSAGSSIACCQSDWGRAASRKMALPVPSAVPFFGIGRYSRGTGSPSFWLIAQPRILMPTLCLESQPEPQAPSPFPGPSLPPGVGPRWVWTELLGPWAAACLPALCLCSLLYWADPCALQFFVTGGVVAAPRVFSEPRIAFCTGTFLVRVEGEGGPRFWAERCLPGTF